MDVAITKISSKGQIVIPLEMRKGFKEGEKLFLIREKGRIIMKKLTGLDEQFKEDMEFARQTEEALKRYDAGMFVEKPAKEFLKDLERW